MGLLGGHGNAPLLALADHGAGRHAALEQIQKAKQRGERGFELVGGHREEGFTHLNGLLGLAVEHDVVDGHGRAARQLLGEVQIVGQEWFTVAAGKRDRALGDIADHQGHAQRVGRVGGRQRAKLLVVGLINLVAQHLGHALHLAVGAQHIYHTDVGEAGHAQAGQAHQVLALVQRAGERLSELGEQAQPILGAHALGDVAQHHDHAHHAAVRVFDRGAAAGHGEAPAAASF